MKTKFGYLHVDYGPDMDGSSRTFEWIEDTPQTMDMSDEDWQDYQKEYGEEKPGWFAKCVVEPEAGWIGPFPTEEEAIMVSTNENAFWSYQNSLSEDI